MKGKMGSKNTAKLNMSSAMCASSMYSHLCMKFFSVALLSQAKKSECGTAQPSWISRGPEPLSEVSISAN